MVWPALLSLMAGGLTAHAQGLQRNSNPEWAVLDFENHTGYGGPEVGRIASDALVVELGKSNKYDVLSRQETEAGLANTGQTPPLDVIGLQRLGRTLGTNAVVTGEVAAVSFSKNPRQATASVVVRVTDSNTGELVNGALAQGTSNPRAISTDDDDALVNEAINNAAFAAVRQLTQFNLPKATVLNNEDQDRVLLNKGTRDGLYDGLNMVVTRNGNEVGRIRVANASQDQSDAVVTRRGLGIQPQDSATAIYQLPAYSVRGNTLEAKADDVNRDGSNSTGGKRGAFSGVTGVLIAVLAGVLLLRFIRRGSGSGSVGGAAVGKVAAQEGRTDVIGGTGVAPGTHQYATTVAGVSVIGIPPAPPLPSNYLPISVHITATVGNIPFQNFIEYHVYRSDFPPVLQDSAVFYEFTATTTTTTTTTNTGTGLANFGQIPVLVQPTGSPLSVYDDGGDKLSITASKPTLTIGNTNSTGTTNGTTNGGTGNTVIQVAGENPAGIAGTGIQHVGDRFYYLIEGLYQQQVTGLLATNSGTSNSGTTNSGTTSSGTTNSGGTTNSTTGPTIVTDYFLTGRSQTNYVTYLDPVDFQATTGTGGQFNGSGPDSLVISVPSTRGADTYVLDISTDPGFGSGVRELTPDSTGPYTATVNAPRAGNPVQFFLQTGSRSGSLRQLFPNATQLFARIGARDSRNGPSTGLNPYIYSDPVAVPAAFVP